MLRIACVLLLALCTVATVRAAGLPADALDCPYDYVNTSWTCPDGIGFDKWTCQPGASPQSPIDLPISFGEALNHFASVGRGPIDVSFDDNVTSDVTFPASGGVSFDNVIMTNDVPDTDELLGFNVRIPSEHTFDGNHADIEFQFVYYNSNSSRYVIVAVLANITYTGAISPGIKAIHDALNSNSLSDNSVFSADLSDLKDGQSFWSYTGSFTTPPCAPADWLVAATLQRISEPVFFDFGNFISANNTLGQTIATPPRPTQPINGRSAVYLDPATSRSNSGNWKVAVGVSAALLGVIFIILIIGAVVFRN